MKTFSDSWIWFLCTLTDKCGGNKRLLRRYKTEAVWKGLQTLLLSVLKSQTLFIEISAFPGLEYSAGALWKNVSVCVFISF